MCPAGDCALLTNDRCLARKASLRLSHRSQPSGESAQPFDKNSFARLLYHNSELSQWQSKVRICHCGNMTQARRNSVPGDRRINSSNHLCNVQRNTLSAQTRPFTKWRSTIFSRKKWIRMTINQAKALISAVRKVESDRRYPRHRVTSSRCVLLLFVTRQYPAVSHSPSAVYENSSESVYETNFGTIVELWYTDTDIYRISYILDSFLVRMVETHENLVTNGISDISDEILSPAFPYIRGLLFSIFLRYLTGWT